MNCKKNYHIFISLIIFILLLAGCGGGDTTSSPSSKTTLSGTITTPDGSSPATLTVMSLGARSAISQQGTFTTSVYQDGVTLVAALPDGKQFGLMNVVSASTTSNASATKQVLKTAYSTATALNSIALNSKTTAVSLVFITPQLLTSNPTKASQIITVIENDPQVAVLAGIIDTVYSSADPLSDNSLQQALISSVQSVLNTLASQATPKAVARSSSMTTTPKVISLPKKSLLSVLLGTTIQPATPYYDDQDYITVHGKQDGSSYDLNIESRNLGSVDWVGEVMKIDSTSFASLADFQATAMDKRYIFQNEKANVIGALDAPAKSIFRYVDIVSEGTDLLFDYSGLNPPTTVSVPATEDGVYLVRSYSGAWGAAVDSGEKSFVRNDVPHGQFMDNLAMTDNIVLVALDGVSLVVDIKELTSNELLKVVIKSAIDVASNELSSVLSQTGNPSIEQLLGIFVDVLKSMLINVANDVIHQGLGGIIQRTGHIALGSLFDYTGKVSSGGQALDRVGQMLTSATPLETAIVVVGTPFVSQGQYSISGRVTSNGAALSGVTVTLTGSGSNSTVTDSNGNYTFANAANGSYTLTPSLSGYSFNPSSVSVTVSNGDAMVQDVVATVYSNPGGGGSNIFYSNGYGKGFSAYNIIQKNSTTYLTTSSIYDLTVNGSKVAYIDVNGDINQFDISSMANAKLSSGASYVDPSYLTSTSALVSDALGKIYTSNLSTWSPSQMTAIASGYKPVAVGGSNGAEMLYSTAVNFQYTTLYKFTFQSSASTQLLTAAALGASSLSDYSTSPDGAYIAVSAYVNSVPTIFVTDKNGQNVSQITTGMRVCWSPDGKYLAYIDGIDMMTGIGKLYIVEIATKTKKQLMNASAAAITATDSAISWQ